jgi:electron transport complex protein RnfD
MPIHMLSGAAVLGAFFIATDYVTSPVSRSGQLLFGAGIGALTWVIRSLGGYPEGLAFAVVLMNALVPLIDKGLRPRVFGRTRRGKSLQGKNVPKINL